MFVCVFVFVCWNSFQLKLKILRLGVITPVWVQAQCGEVQLAVVVVVVIVDVGNAEAMRKSKPVHGRFPG